MAWPAVRIPIDCPRCRKVLYPIKRDRPRSKLSPLGKALLVASGLVAAGVFAGGGVLALEYLRQRVRVDPEVGRVLGIILIVPAVLAGLPFAWMAYRLPRVHRLRCRSCGWHDAFRSR